MLKSIWTGRESFNESSPAKSLRRGHRGSPLAIDPAKITVEPRLSYLPSPIKLHDYAGGVMAAFGSVVEYIGSLRGLPSSRKMLTARRPRARYVVGVGPKLQMALMTNIPTWVRDQVLQRVSGQP